MIRSFSSLKGGLRWAPPFKFDVKRPPYCLNSALVPTQRFLSFLGQTHSLASQLRPPFAEKGRLPVRQLWPAYKARHEIQF